MTLPWLDWYSACSSKGRYATAARIDSFESICGWCLDRHWHILHIMVVNTEGRSLCFLRPHSGAREALVDLMCNVYVLFI